ncbi:MAG: hypothetical protein LCI00_02135 [Chloroflexi bacterium]|nr:hypothetical protein [Chloroflexota bacterium]MCC6895510.1 hypothetical protein [Anaerolineae bacterium]
MNQPCFQIIAQLSQYRTVLHYPQHQMVRVIWNNTTLRFDEPRFMQLIEFISQATLENMNIASDQNRLIQTDDGCIELWVGESGLHLLPFDFLMLSSMLWSALEALAPSEVPQSAAPQQPEQVTTQEKPKRPRFSQN